MTLQYVLNISIKPVSSKHRKVGGVHISYDLFDCCTLHYSILYPFKSTTIIHEKMNNTTNLEDAASVQQDENRNIGSGKARGLRTQLLHLGFGQIIMLLNVSSSINTKYLSVNNASVPTFQSIFLYVSLALVYIPVRFLRKTPAIGVPWWFYIILAIVDIEANYAAVNAFNYANFATLGLLLNLTVPFVTLFCYIFLKTRYNWTHYLGAATSVAGSVVIFVADYDKSINGELSQELKGDFLCLLAAFLYAVSNVMIQSVVKVRNVDSNIELLGSMGFWASIVSTIQVMSLERKKIEAIDWEGKLYGYLIGYVIALFLFYSISSIFLRVTESVMFNLSLLTSPVFTVLASYFLFDESVNKYYWIALVLVYIGIAIYSIDTPKETNQKMGGEGTTTAVQSTAYEQYTSPHLEEPIVNPNNNVGHL
jgi:solute carrier family 35 protein F1/2